MTLDDTKWHIEIRDQCVARGTKKSNFGYVVGAATVISLFFRGSDENEFKRTHSQKKELHTYHIGAKTDGRYFHAIIQFNERNFICHVEQTNRSEWIEFYNLFFFPTRQHNEKFPVPKIYPLNWCEAIARLNADDQHKSCRSYNWQFTIEHCSHHVFAFLFHSRFFFVFFSLYDFNAANVRLQESSPLWMCATMDVWHLCGEHFRRLADVRRISAIE